MSGILNAWLAFFTGMRAGEQIGLKRNNIDFNRKIIKVAKTRVYGENP